MHENTIFVHETKHSYTKTETSKKKKNELHVERFNITSESTTGAQLASASSDDDDPASNQVTFYAFKAAERAFFAYETVRDTSSSSLSSPSSSYNHYHPSSSWIPCKHGFHAHIDSMQKITYYVHKHMQGKQNKNGLHFLEVVAECTVVDPDV